MIRPACLLLLTSVALATLLGWPVPASAQTTMDVGRLAGSGTAPVKKQVRTMRDLRFRELTQQRFDFSCGSAALATLLQHGYGIETTETELIKAMLEGVDVETVRKNGFSMLDMKRYVESIGMRGHGFKIDTDALYRLQVPVIALLDLKGYKHFVVVKGAAAGRVFVADPALGHRVMRETDFAAGWNGVVLAVLAGQPMRADSYLLNSRHSPALQNRLVALEHATTPPRVVEFGLVYADMF